MEKEANAKRKGEATTNKLEQFSNHSPHRILSRYYLEIVFFRQQFCLTNNQPVFEWFVQNENTTTESKYRNCECDSEFFALFLMFRARFARSIRVKRVCQMLKAARYQDKTKS